MKLKLDIDWTPEEARAFLGLPDVAPLQRALVAEMEGRMRAALAAMDPESMIKMWLPAGLEGWDKMQKLFWSQLAGGARTEKPAERKK